MLRNPVDMMYSLYSQFIYEGFEDIAQFRESLRSGRRSPARIAYTECPHLAREISAKSYLYYREVAKYAHQIQRYLENFGREVGSYYYF